MNNPARLADLTSRGYCGSAALGQVRLDEAWRQLLLEVPSIPSSVAAGLLTTAQVADVVAAAAKRVLRNEDGIEESSTEIDDYRESYKRADSTEDVYFTAAEIRRMTQVIVPTSGSVKYA